MDRTEAALRPGLFVGAAPFGRRGLIELLRRSIESARAQARPAQRRARAGAAQSRLAESLERRTPRAAAHGVTIRQLFTPGASNLEMRQLNFPLAARNVIFSLV